LKLERLLREARVADTAAACTTKLRRAYGLVARAYADIGERFDLVRPNHR
jgi:hypothetical protein